MGGLRKKMPWTAGTMLVGCLAIAGAGVPLVVGLSGYYSKDSILAQVFSFKGLNTQYSWLFYAAAGGAAITAFYMFRLWYMTFAGEPRDEHIYEHAHESPKVMYVPLVILAFLAATAGWVIPFTNIEIPTVLEQARPAGTADGVSVTGPRLAPDLAMPAEYLSHQPAIHVPVSFIAFGTALAGFLFATAFYGLRTLDPEDARKTFGRLYDFVKNKWWFDELYDFVFVRPVLKISNWVAAIDRRGIDWVADNLAYGVQALSRVDDWIDRLFVDGPINWIARWTYRAGLWLRTLQTGQLRQYVMLIVVGTVALFVLISLY
jgi:NADH-quinone oxidoreductase subunit L